MPLLTARKFEPIDGRLSMTAARILFLKAIQKVAPEVLADLADEPLRVIRESELPEDVVEQLAMSIAQNRECHDLKYKLTHAQPLYNAVSGWATRHNLFENWVLEQACHTLHKWITRGHLIGKGFQFRFSLSYHPLELPPGLSEFMFRSSIECSLEYGRFNRKGEERRIKSEFNEKLKERLDEIENHYREFARNPEVQDLNNTFAKKGL